MTAAGKHMDAIVVDSRHIVAECIHYLKDQRIGVCSFIPLDTIITSLPPERLRTFGSMYHLCIDLIEIDEHLKPAILYAVGNSIVCDNLDDAQVDIYFIYVYNIYIM